MKDTSKQSNVCFNSDLNGFIKFWAFDYLTTSFQLSELHAKHLKDPEINATTNEICEIDLINRNYCLHYN